MICLHAHEIEELRAEVQRLRGARPARLSLLPRTTSMARRTYLLCKLHWILRHTRGRATEESGGSETCLHVWVRVLFFR